jgi:decaprenylphospho-beta-D-erythro-pentofuranosid-2-ulose 2-reductase
VTDRILVTGATSGIGRALARRLAARGDALVLAARSSRELTLLARDLEIRHGAPIECEVFEATDPASNAELVARTLTGGDLAGVFLCHGAMAEQQSAEDDAQIAWDMTAVNLLSPISILEALAPHFESRGTGSICAISSVAGDRGRRSNSIYGASKAALNVYLEGLESRLVPQGISVTTVKPGFVDTRMTWGKSLPFLADPDAVARDCLTGVRKKRSVVYTPGFWRFIMLGLRFLPRALFRRLPL